jgi:phosphoglycerol transferase MdoB-like AlkP superfamily enzyme
MKYILAIMCGLVVLFMGGCALVTSATGLLAPIPAGIAFLNLAILGGLFGWRLRWTPAFYILGVFDLLIAFGCGWVAASLTSSSDRAFAPFIWAIVLVIAAKGVLSFAYANQSKENIK